MDEFLIFLLMCLLNKIKSTSVIWLFEDGYLPYIT